MSVIAQHENNDMSSVIVSHRNCYCVSNVQVSDVDVSDESQSVIIADGTTR